MQQDDIVIGGLTVKGQRFAEVTDASGLSSIFPVSRPIHPHPHPWLSPHGPQSQRWPALRPFAPNRPQYVAFDGIVGLAFDSLR
jgi:hypothetical protein